MPPPRLPPMHLLVYGPNATILILDILGDYWEPFASVSIVLPEPALRNKCLLGDCSGHSQNDGNDGINTQIRHGMDHPFSQKAGTAAEPSLSPSSGKGETTRLKMFHTRHLITPQ
jgi:hypothetical protein